MPITNLIRLFSSVEHPSIGRFITWLMRVLVGVTFIFSGFVKAIDPWGTLYKFEDYIRVIDWNLPVNLLLAGVFTLCAYEFCIGIFIFLGCYRRSAPIGAGLLMIIMLPLTLWIAIKNPVADCGCFGDALIISNWTTFWKNVVLTLAILWLVRYNRMCRCLIRPYIQWLSFLCSGAFILIIGLVGYFYQPLIDFRAFPIGTNLAKVIGNFSDEDYEGEENEVDTSGSDIEGDEESDMIFIYAKDGVEKAFTISDELPEEEEGWQFIRRESSDKNKVDNDVDGITERKNVSAKEEIGSDASLILWDSEGNEELTSSVITGKGRQILLLMPDLKNVSMAETWKINSLYQWAIDNGIDMVGIVSGSREEIENWEDISLSSYPIYTADDTQIKTLARGNPAVVILNDGIINWKSTLKAMVTEDFQAADTGKDPSRFYIENHTILMKIIYTYLAVMGCLIAFSFLPAIAYLFPSKLEKSISRQDEKISITEKKMRNFNQEGHSSVKK